jgi:hypothetical protein
MINRLYHREITFASYFQRLKQPVPTFGNSRFSTKGARLSPRPRILFIVFQIGFYQRFGRLCRFSYYMTRTFRHARQTSRTLFIIDYRQIVDHCYRALRTVFRADSASYAADLAERRGFLALAVRGAADVNLRAYGDSVYAVFGTFRNT